MRHISSTHCPLVKVRPSSDNPYRGVISHRSPEYQYPWFQFYRAFKFYLVSPEGGPCIKWRGKKETPSCPWYHIVPPGTRVLSYVSTYHTLQHTTHKRYQIYHSNRPIICPFGIHIIIEHKRGKGKHNNGEAPCANSWNGGGQGTVGFYPTCIICLILFLGLRPAGPGD